MYTKINGRHQAAACSWKKKTSNQLNIRKLPRPQLRYYRYKIRMDDDTRRNSGIIPDALTLAYEHFLLGCTMIESCCLMVNQWKLHSK